MFVQKNDIDLVINSIEKPIIDLSRNHHLVLDDFRSAIFSTERLILPIEVELIRENEIQVDFVNLISNQLISANTRISSKNIDELLFTNCVLLSGNQLNRYSYFTFSNCYLSEEVFEEIEYVDRIELNECYLNDKMLKRIFSLAPSLQLIDVICSIRDFNGFKRNFDDISYKLVDNNRYYIFYACY
jgi:hypothetical protein